MSAVLEDQIARLERRVDELESRAAMRDLVTDYCQGFDNLDWERFIGAWWEDAVWEIGPPFGEPVGVFGGQSPVCSQSQKCETERRGGRGLDRHGADGGVGGGRDGALQTILSFLAFLTY